MSSAGADQSYEQVMLIEEDSNNDPHAYLVPLQSFPEEMADNIKMRNASKIIKLHWDAHSNDPLMVYIANNMYDGKSIRERGGAHAPKTLTPSSAVYIIVVYFG